MALTGIVHAPKSSDQPRAQQLTAHLLTLSPSPHAPAAGHAVVGCFLEPTIQPDGTCQNEGGLSMMFLGNVNGASHDACADLAGSEGMRYYALQAGKKCFGSNNVDAYTEPGRCNISCLNTPSQQWWVCGALMGKGLGRAGCSSERHAHARDGHATVHLQMAMPGLTCTTACKSVVDCSRVYCEV